MKEASRLLLTISTFILLFTSSELVVGQEHSIGTPCATPGDYPEWLAGYLANPNKPTARNADDIIYMPITVHTVGEDDGEGHYPTIKIFESICRLNEDFEPYNIQFYLKDDIQKINRTRYYDHESFSDGQRMMQSFNKSLSINAYITNQAPNNACGYYHPGGDAIVVIKSCMGGNAHTLTHEVGHWLSLPHTFAGWEGREFDPQENTPEFLSIRGRDTLFVESVSGRNCDRAGDRFCDTSPDYLSVGWNCNGNFESVQVQIDPEGNDFRSDGRNFMSYSTDPCQSEFSAEQVDAMRAYIEFAKSFHASDAPRYQPVSKEPVNILFPDNEDKVGHEGIRLEWEHHPNATHYLVNISRFSFFVTIDYEFIVNGNTLTLDLPVDRNWYWRIKPYNENDVCADFTEAGGFTTYDVTNVEEIQANNYLDVFPTIIQKQQSLINIDFQFSDILTTDIEILSATGQRLIHRRLENPGFSLFEMPVQDLTSGLYVLKVSTEKGQLIRRVIIQ